MGQGEGPARLIYQQGLQEGGGGLKTQQQGESALLVHAIIENSAGPEE